MATTTTDYYLPLEIIIDIIGEILPKDPVPVTLPPSHLITKTLLSLALTSRAIYPIAVQYLYEHCLYIDSSPRLSSLLEGLTHRRVVGCQSNVSAEKINSVESISRLQQPVFRPTALYLAPFLDDIRIIDRKVVENVDQLFRYLAPTLTRLVAEFPFRDWKHNDYRGYEGNDSDGEVDTSHEDFSSLYSVLRASFERLIHLQVYCDVRSELRLPINRDRRDDSLKDPVWKAWPDLRILALYNPNVEYAEFWGHLAERTKLETVVFSRPAGVCNTDTDLTKRWRTQIQRLNPGTEPRPLAFVTVHLETDPEMCHHYDTDLKWVVPREIRVATSSDYEKEDQDIHCEIRVKRLMLKGMPVDEWADWI